MAGYVVAVLLGSEGAFTGPLFIPLGVAVSVVVLLWIPQESQAFFGGADRRRPGRAAAPDLRPPPAVDRPAPPPVRRPVRPHVAPGRCRRRTAGTPPSPAATAAAHRSAVPPPAAPVRPRPSAADVPRRPPARVAPTARARPPTVAAPPPPARPAGGLRLGPARRRRRRAAPTRPHRPGWLLEAPPAGFWPPERRRAEPRQYEVVDVGPPGPRPPGGARPRRPVRHHVVVPGPRGRGAGPGRLPGLDGDVRRPRRHRLPGHLDAARDVVPPARRVSPGRERRPGRSTAAPAGWRCGASRSTRSTGCRPRASADDGHLTLKGWDVDQPWALLAKPRVATDGAFRPARLAELADVVNRAKHSSA